MKGFQLALRSEWFIAVRTLGSKLVILVPSLLVLISFLLTKLGETGAAARDSLLGSSDFDASVTGNAWGHFVDGLDSGMTVLGLLLVAQAAYGFSSDRDTGAVRHLLVRSSSRLAIGLAKLVQLHLIALISIILLIITSYFASGLLWEYGPVVEDGFELIGEAEIQREITLGLWLALIPLPAAIALGLLASVLANNSTQAVVSALGLTLALDLFKATLGDYALYLYATFQPSLLDQSYLQEVGRLVRGYSDVLIDERFLQMNTWAPLPALFLFIAVMLIVVNRRQL
jgi:ABC-type transport system involved in multi-copper enzyme maturation permease subunit